MPDAIQPIATAPRDGTRILVFVPPQDGDASDDSGWVQNIRGWFTAWYERDQWVTGFRDYDDVQGSLEDPTHWMFLPDPPA